MTIKTSRHNRLVLYLSMQQIYNAKKGIWIVLLVACNKNSKETPSTPLTKIVDAEFTISGTPLINENLKFTPSFATNDMLIEWDFGDDSISHAFTPIRRYYHTDTFTVKLTVDGDTANSISKTLIISRNDDFLENRYWTGVCRIDCQPQEGTQVIYTDIYTDSLLQIITGTFNVNFFNACFTCNSEHSDSTVLTYTIIEPYKCLGVDGWLKYFPLNDSCAAIFNNRDVVCGYEYELFSSH